MIGLRQETGVLEEPVHQHPATLLSDKNYANREWYFRASAEFSSILIGSEIEQILQYTTDVETHVHNLCVLWMTDPFPRDLFVQEAVCIIERSDAIEGNVGTLKNTVVRFLHTGKSDERMMSRSRKVRRRIVRRRCTPVIPENQDHRQQGEGIS
jgi:hypothetical protein